MRIGILQTGDAPEELQAQYGNYSNMFVRLLGQHYTGLEFVVFRVIDAQIPPTVNACDGWLITGSKFSVYGSQPWIPALKAFIRDIADAGLPLAGICFGHQIIVEALGGHVEKSEKGWGLGLDTYHIAPDTLPGALDKITLNIFHQDQVVRLPPDAKVFAHSDFCEYAGLLIGEQIMTIQAHPEFERAFNHQLLEARKTSVIPEVLANEAIIELNAQEPKTDSDHFGAGLVDFFRARQTA